MLRLGARGRLWSRRPRGPADLAIRLLVFNVAVSLGVACRPVVSEVSYRPASSTIARDAFHPIEIGSTARPAFATKSAADITFDFNGIGRGSLVLHAGKRAVSDREASLAAKFRCNDLVSTIIRREPSSCSVSWDPSDVSERWQPCRLAIERPCSEGVVSVTVHADPTADIVVSEPMLHGVDSSLRPDVYFIVVDTARADRLRPFADALPLGAALSRLGNDSLVFERARSTSSWTRPATVTMLSGLRPESHGVHDRRDALPASIPTLPAILRDNGYFTFALSANANVLPVWGFANGYDEFHDAGANNWATAKTDARTLFDHLIDELESDSPGPGFYYVHLMDPHAPYIPSAADLAAVEAIPGVEETFPHRTWEFGREKEVQQYIKYLGELRDADAEIGRFVDYLRAAGRYKDSLIVVVSDHGEEFRDHGLVYHGTGLFEEVLRVPMVIKLPASAELSGRIDASIGIEHLTPTLLTALKLSVPNRQDGRSAIEALPRDSATDGSEVTRFQLADWLSQPPAPQFATLKLDRSRVSAIVAEPWKLIKYHHVESELLYNLKEDPLETQNLAAEQREKLDEMRELLAQEMARRHIGWHLLFCGASVPAALVYRLRGASEELLGRDLEPEDQLGPLEGDGTRVISLRLPLISFEVEELGTMVQRTVPDQDKVLIGSADLPGLFLDSLDPAPLRYTVGNSRELQESRELNLSELVTQATIAGHEWLECPLAETDLTGRAIAEETKPYVRIWRVAPRSKVDPTDVSPEVIERLRQLGYTW